MVSDCSEANSLRQAFKYRLQIQQQIAKLERGSTRLLMHFFSRQGMTAASKRPFRYGKILLMSAAIGQIVG